MGCRDGESLQLLEGTYSVKNISWSPDGNILASVSLDHNMYLWDAATGQLLQTLVGHTDDVGSMSWSPDGSALASVMTAPYVCGMQRQVNHCKLLWGIRIEF
ncbi:MAG: hypothetical protein AAF639_16905 [Chloroflexota bacterium]